MVTFESARVEALVESARLLQSAADVDQLLAHLLRAAMAHALTRRGCVAYDDGSGMRIRHGRGIPADRVGASWDAESLREIGIARVFPLGHEDSPVALLGLGPSAGDASEERDQFLAALAGISAGAIENVRFSSDVRRLNQSLDRRVHDLRTLLGLVRDFTAVTDPDEVARMLSLTLAGQWTVARHFVTAWRAGHPDVARASRGVTLPAAAAMRALAGSIGDWSRAGELADAGLREAFTAAKIVVLVPIRSGEETIGLVGLGARSGGVAYDDDDAVYTRGLVDQAAVALENAWNFREMLEKKKIEKELELAADIQRRLLPEAIPRSALLDAAAATRPARHVGGDYYDVVRLPGGELLHCVADVSGKGVAASLLMSNFQASLRALASASLPLPDLVARMNGLMHASTAANKYVTAIFAVIDPATGRCSFVNAGHNDGFVVRRDGTVEAIKAGGLAVGLLPGRTYSAVEVSLDEGDLIAMYSDGVTEANDPDENEFGAERLLEILKGRDRVALPDLVKEIYEAVDRFADTAPQYDDITVMLVRKGVEN